MRYTNRKPLTHTLLVLPVFAAAHLISACDASSDSTQSTDQQSRVTPGGNPLIAASRGTVAVSPEALFDFLYVATRFEFWSCASSDSTTMFIALDSKDDETDEGFNPLLLLGLLREPQLPGDPRALSDEDKTNDVELQTTPVSFAVTGSDSITITLHARSDFIPSVDDTLVYLTEVRTGPGRTFTAEKQQDNTRINCTANSVSANIMF